jgi:heat shock protein HslJ
MARKTKSKGELTMFHKNLQPKIIQITSVMLLISLISVALAAFSSLKVEASITEKPWQWVGLVETNPASQSVVPDPENYTLLFSPDGSLNIVADCNMAGGSYALDGSSLTIELGPSTMAFCGEQSLDYLYLALLSNVESYAVEDGQLVLELKDSAGNMFFE